MWNYKDEEDFNDENFSRGAGDADSFGYPGERHYIDGAKSNPIMTFDRPPGRRDSYPFSEGDYDPRIDEDLEDIDE